MSIMNFIGGPTILIFIGALLAAIGAVWSNIDQTKYNEKLNEKNEEIARLSKEIVHSVTGGDTICYIMPISNQPDFGTLVSVGNYPLYDLTARFTDLEEFEKNPEKTITYDSLLRGDNILNLNELPPKSAKPLGSIFKLHGDTRRWNIFFSARNGFFTELLRMKKVDGKWISAVQITKLEGTENKVVFEKIPEDFPRNPDGTVDWK